MANKESTPRTEVLRAEDDAATVTDNLTLGNSQTPEGYDLEPSKPHYQFTTGGSFILDQPDTPPAIWGHGSNILWAEGEALMIAGPQGTGKTTIGQQLALGRCGLSEYSTLLGYPVTPGKRRTLYLAMDRPKQVARSFRRMVGAADRGQLDERLVIWQGPPPQDLAKNPKLLAELALAAQADTVIVDSLKDAAMGTSTDESGAGLNLARQHALREGIEVVELHHMRKSPATGGKERPTIDSIYGSTWLTSGTGSVIILTGEARDPVIGFFHVKQPMEEVGPFELAHNHEDGRTAICEQVDLLELAKTSITVKAAAQAMFETDTPTRSQTNRARTQLNQLVGKGLEVVREGSQSPPVAAEYRTVGGVKPL